MQNAKTNTATLELELLKDDFKKYHSLTSFFSPKNKPEYTFPKRMYGHGPWCPTGNFSLSSKFTIEELNVAGKFEAFRRPFICFENIPVHQNEWMRIAITLQCSLIITTDSIPMFAVIYNKGYVRGFESDHESVFVIKDAKIAE